MKTREINPAKLKIYFELDHQRPQGNRGISKGSIDDLNFPFISRLNDHRIFFEQAISENQFAKIKKMAILIFTLGRWKEYPVVSFTVDTKETGLAQFPSLEFAVDEKSKTNFKNDLLLALI